MVSFLLFPQISIVILSVRSSQLKRERARKRKRDSSFQSSVKIDQNIKKAAEAETPSAAVSCSFCQTLTTVLFLSIFPSFFAGEIKMAPGDIWLNFVRSSGSTQIKYEVCWQPIERMMGPPRG